MNSSQQAHLEYLHSAAGLEAAAAFGTAIEARLDDWRAFWLRINIVIPALLVALLIAEPIMVYALGRDAAIDDALMAGALVAIVLTVMGFFYAAPRIGWMPYAVRSFWFRKLPPKSIQLRDHLIALYDA